MYYLHNTMNTTDINTHIGYIPTSRITRIYDELKKISLCKKIWPRTVPSDRQFPVNDNKTFAGELCTFFNIARQLVLGDRLKKLQ